MTTHRLVLLRHAKAEHGLDVPDHDRPLTLRGIRQALEAGVGLAGAGLTPNLVLCSSAVRALRTWASMAKAFDTEPELRVSDALYDAGVEDVLAALREVGEAVPTVLVVGHEPTMSATATALAALGSDEGTYARVRSGVPTAGWTVLDVVGPWSALARGGAHLRHLGVPAS